ncbi:unnamed protein product, partial [Heterosigma akashiwo]
KKTTNDCQTAINHDTLTTDRKSRQKTGDRGPNPRRQGGKNRRTKCNEDDELLVLTFRRWQ